MSVLKIKNENNEFISIQTIKGDKGENGKDGVVQYTAGNNITIENNVISAAVPTKTSDLTNDNNFLSTETDPTVPAHVKAITETNINNWNNKSNFSGSYDDLTNKPTIPSKTSDLTNDSSFIDKDVNNLTNYYKKSEIDTSLNTKQNTLTFDTTPTSGSSNPVTSGGVKSALDLKLNSSSITSGTSEPTGGQDGDIYFQYS